MPDSQTYPKKFDVIVVGGGHAGVEAALAAARMQCETLLVTHSIDTIGQMSCNPAIGGIGKGHIVKEIDALGGVMATAIDQAGIHFRILNGSKGAAVQATRAQADRTLYKAAIRWAVEHQPQLTIFQQGVDDLLVRGDTVYGIRTQLGIEFSAATVVLTTGTFLHGKIHVGLVNSHGGRAGEPPAQALAERLRALPFSVARLKTGTPPRIDGNTIDYTALEVQPGDEPVPAFSFDPKHPHPRQISCHITHTNPRTHAIIKSALAESPIYSGLLEGVGPRYCPSIEDKIVRFAERSSHQIFIEPEGLESTEVYPNGISTSLPFGQQLAFVRSIHGFENAHITRPGYAIEYDFFDPRGLKNSLETKCINGLFFAGQINGTTGYEEAAGQGLIAGANAALQVKQQPSWCPARSEAYIGVMIDDLVTRGTNEPYRMFTSRAEYRLLLREDNADLRLTEKGFALGLVAAARMASFTRKREAIAKERTRFEKTWLQPAQIGAARTTELIGQPLQRATQLFDLLSRREVAYDAIVELAALTEPLTDRAAIRQLEIQARYRGYIERQVAEIARTASSEHTPLPAQINYDAVPGLSTEVRQKLVATQPQTIGQAARIPGLTPAAISLLLVHLKKRERVAR